MKWVSFFSNAFVCPFRLLLLCTTIFLLSVSLNSFFPLFPLPSFPSSHHQLHFESSAIVAEHARCIAVLVEIAPFLVDACRADAELLEYLHLLPAVCVLCGVCSMGVVLCVFVIFMAELI